MKGMGAFSRFSLVVGGSPEGVLDMDPFDDQNLAVLFDFSGRFGREFAM